MGTNITGIGNANAIGFKSRVTGGIYFPPELKDALVGVWSAYGKSNDSTDRNIIKNKIKDRGGDFVISNAAFKLNSGFGKYEVDFTSWIQTNGVIVSSDKVQNSIIDRFLYFNTVNKKEDIPSFKVNITLGQQGKLQYNYIKEDGTSTYIVYSESGIYTIPTSYFSKYTGGNAWFGFYQIEGTSIIEQIPSFEGAFVTDGIDDLITSTKTLQEMLEGSNKITVVSMIHQIELNNVGASFTNYCRKVEVGYVRNETRDYGTTGIYGWSISNVNDSNSVNRNFINNILGDKELYSIDSVGDITNSIFSVNGYENASNSPSETSQLAWYWTIIANKVLTTDQINQVIAYYNLDRCVEPTVLYDVKRQGLSNDTPDSDWYLKDFSKNGFDMSLFNFAKKGNSGVGKYETDLSDIRIWIQSRDVTSSPFSSSYNGLSGWIIFANTELTNSVDMPSFKIQVKGLLEGQELIYRYYDSNGQSNVYSITKDGDYTLPSDFRTAKPQISNTSGFQVVKNEANIITITQIPSHAGALCLDGVNNFGKVTGMPVYKDYTIIADYERLKINIGVDGDSAILSKSESVELGAFIFNTISINGDKVSYSFGCRNIINTDDTIRKIFYQSKYINDGQDINIESTFVDSDKLWLGTYRDSDYRFITAAIYSFMSFPYSMSEFLIERQLKKHKLGTLYPDMLEFRPVIKTNVDYTVIQFYINNYTKSIYPGDYIPINTPIEVNFYLKNNVDELISFKVNGNDSTFKRSTIVDNAYNIRTLPITKSPQKINITIDEYIRFEDIVQPYPVLLRFKDENGNEVFWGGKFKVGSTITIIGSAADSNLLPNIYNIFGLLLNGNQVTSSKVIVEKTMVFKAKSAYIFDNNEPKCILSPSRLRIPNSSYKILGYIPDISGHGNHGKINNSAYKLDSGVNGYLVDFTTLKDDGIKGIVRTDSKIYLDKSFNYNQGFWLGRTNNSSPAYKVKVSGIPETGMLTYTGGVGLNLVNGINELPARTNTEEEYGFVIQSPNLDWSNLVIEQIGKYEGAYCLDGVDDFVTIPTLSSGGKQVLMKVNWNTINSIIYDQRGRGGFAIYCSDYNNGGDSVTIPAYKGRNAAGTTYIDGIRNEYVIASQLRNVTHNIVEILDNSHAAGNINPIIGKSSVIVRYGKLALYDFMLFDNISTDDKIKELNEYVGIEAKVELPPYYWDAYGKTNLDADKATIQQRGVAVGDYDLTNTNFAYDKMSGFGGYTLGKFTNSWSLNNNSNSISIVARNPYDITLKKLGENSDWEFNTTELKIISNPVSVKFKSDKNIRFTCDYHYYTVGGNSESAPLEITSKDLIANEDTIITISPISQENIDKYNIDINRGYYLIYFQLSLTLAVNEEVTIEMLPLYPNGLVYDGITDYSENANIPALTDFTVITKRVWMNKDNPMNECFIHKGVVSTPIKESALMLEYEIGNDTYYRSSSYGGYIDIERSNRPEIITYQTTESYNGISIIKGSGIDTQGLVVGAVTNNYWKGVFYKLMLYPKTITNLEIMFLKNMFERDEIIDLTNPIFIKNE